MTDISWSEESPGRPAIRAARVTLLMLWHLVRLPVVAILGILEPVVSLALGTLATLGLLMTFFFELVGPPSFPFWTMMALSLGCFFVLVGYEALVRVLSR